MEVEMINTVKRRLMKSKSGFKKKFRKEKWEHEW
jgi:hypothetical protein